MSDEEVGADYRDVDVVAKFLNITARRVQQLASEGVIPKGERGKYHLVGSIRGYIKYLQDRAEGRSAEGSQLQDERTRLARLQSEEIELRLAEKRGLLVPADQVEPLWSGMVTAAKSFLRAEVNRLAQLLQHTDGAEAKRDLLSETFDDFLTKLSGYDPDADARIDAGADRRADAARPAAPLLVAPGAAAADVSGAVG